MKKPQRPAFVLLLALFQMFVGGVLICSGALGLASHYSDGSAATVTVNKGGGQKETIVYDTRVEMEREAPGYHTVYLVTGVAGLALAVLMILGATGLFLQGAWGWWLSLLWTLAAFAYQAGVAVYLWTVAMPAANRMVKVVPHDEAGVCGGLVNGNTLFHLVWALFASGFAFYPLLILIFLVLPVVRRSSRPVEPDSYGAEEDDRPRRRRRDRDEDDDYDRRPRPRRRDRND